MDSFQGLLLEVDKRLRKEDIKALTFLCHDLLDRNSSAVTSAKELFSRLVDRDYLSAEHPDLLTELLVNIQRRDVVRDLRLNLPRRGHISPISSYRLMLFNLSEEMTDEEFKNIKYLLEKTLGQRRLQDCSSTLDVFLELERQDLLSDTNLEELEELITHVCHRLKKKINQYKEESVPPLPVEENGPPPHGGFNYEANLNEPVEDLVSIDAAPFARTEVNVTRPEAQETSAITEDLREYSMTAGKRGICLIINNYKFTPESELKIREGTKIDEDSLKAVFSWLGFVIDVRSDCTGAQMLSVLQELGQADHGKADCVVICILSHGLEGRVQGVDGESVELWKLQEPLNGSNCRSLVGKPKLFFIQACQGNMEQRAVHLEADGPIRSDAGTTPLVVTIPLDADFLLAMSTVPSYISFRDRKKGSWFIQCLCQNLVRMVPRKDDLMSILTKVNGDVSLKSKPVSEGLFSKQMPQPSLTLRHKVIFPVPKAPPPHLPSN